MTFYLYAFGCPLHSYVTNLGLWLQQTIKIYLLTHEAGSTESSLE